MKRVKGFTLIELLVVVAIIGILATIITISVTNAQSKSRDSKRKGDLETVAKALDMFFIDNKYYPGAGTACAFSMYVPDRPASDSGIEDLMPTYLGTIPFDPKRSGSWTNRCYSYSDYLYVGQSPVANSQYARVALLARLENTNDSSATAVKTDLNSYFNLSTNLYFNPSGGSSGNDWSATWHTQDDCYSNANIYNYWTTQ